MHDILVSPWFWWGAALALFALEAMLPGTFMLWLGFAAAGTGLVHLLLPSLGVPAQWMVFSLLAIISIIAGWRYKKRWGASVSDQPLLNQRAQQLVGQVYPLESAISNGRGRVKIGDAFWSVTGPDLPAGTRVRIEAVVGMGLQVAAAE